MPILKWINGVIAVLLIALLGVIYWVAYRTLPQTTGDLHAPVSQNAVIRRDALGVPHIEAANWEDAIFLQGYATAEDRLWQMDALRRLAAGELSEVVGAGALESDRESRRLRMRRLAEDFNRTLPAQDKAVLAAYGRGVNFYIETHRGKLPLEFTLLGYDPRPWSPVDSILAGLQMYRNLTTSYKDDRTKALMLVGGDPAKVDFLFPSRTGMELQPGSNAWAMSGAHTASGKPLLANDPHLEYSAPSTWHMVHVRGGDLDVTGVALPGVPCVIVGHNRNIAWGVTNLQFDVQDLYRERLDPRTGRYLYQGQPQQARLERERIPVKNAKPVPLDIWVTRHGPVVVADGNEFLALRWTAGEPGSFQFPFLDVNRARNWEEFTAAIKRFPGPGQNFVYADVSGNIGYHATGTLPIRTGFLGDVPLDGSSGENEWAGFIPFEQLPSFYNPAPGIIVTANQNPFPEDYPFAVHGMFSPQYRSRQIRDLLVARAQGWKAEDMLSVQKDVYSAFSHRLAQKVVGACDRRKVSNQELRDPVDLLRNWNGQMDKEQAAPMVIALAYIKLRALVGDIASKGRGALYDAQISTSVIEKILTSGGTGWFGNQDETLVKCLADGIEEGKRSQGSDVRRWRYGKYNELTIKQPVGNAVPVFGQYFNVGPIPMSGSSTTVKQTTPRLGPSMRMVVDLGNLDGSLNNITMGESGAILSGHYSDQWDAYYVGRSFPMQFDKVDAKRTLRVLAGQ